MKRKLRVCVALAGVLIAQSCDWRGIRAKTGRDSQDVFADSPASMSIHEEATVFAEGPMMGVFNNLVIFDQHVKQHGLETIVPDLPLADAWKSSG